MEGEDLIREYLGRLEAASWPLSAGRRIELAGEVREHIEAALGEAGKRDAVTVRNVLERLGRPEEIVSAEVDTEPDHGRWSPSPGGLAATTQRWGALEIAAILLLTVGAFALPFIGPVIGLVLVWLSTRWTTREKLVATVIVVAIFILPIILLLGVGAQSSSGIHPG